MPDIVNPYIAGNPVTGTEMFFGRDDVFTFVQQALRGQHRDNVIVLYGQRRTGKTSVLYQMHRHLDQRYLCIFIDLHGLALEGLNGFVWELANTIARSLRKDYEIDLPRPTDRAEFMADARGSFENDFLPQVWSAIGERHILLMLDEAIRLQEQIQAGKLAKEVFEYLRHLMQHHERLNFLFSLGSGLEEMEKEYAFLFSVGLYKKISFLEREAATALITQPVKDYYQVELAAIDRILQITSGHAYYTQLLCHSLFNRWQQDHQPLITVKAVEAILDEVVERGLAVLKHVWEESTPGEKAVLAGLAAAMGGHNRSFGPKKIDRVWAQHDVTLPESERSKAIKSLIARDVIVGQEKYQFAIDLQRIWVRKYRRLEWVKEEIASDIQRWRRMPRLPPRQLFWRSKPGLVTLGVASLAIAIIALLISRLIIQGQEFEKIRQTATESARSGQATLTSYNSQLGTAEAISLAAANAPAATQTAAADQVKVIAAQATAVAQQLYATATAAAKLFSDQLPPQSLTATPQPPLSPTPCTNDSRFIADVTVPDGTQFGPGTKFTKTWRVLNTGTCSWTPAYEFAFISGEQMAAPLSMALSQMVAPSTTVDVSVRFTAPSSLGSHRSLWQLRDANGMPFGQRPFTHIVVVIGTPTPQSPAARTTVVITSSPVNLLLYAPSAMWSNGSGATGLWLNSYPTENDNVSRGFAVYVPKGRTLETGDVVQNDGQVIQTHPEFKPNGEIRGSFLIALPSRGADFFATLAFLSGARDNPAVDGVHVEVYWCDAQRGTAPCALLDQANASDNGSETSLTANLTRYAGQTGELQLIVNARSNSGNDWLTWTALKTTPR